MVGCRRVVIEESVDDLKILMHQQVKSGDKDQEKIEAFHSLQNWG